MNTINPSSIFQHSWYTQISSKLNGGGAGFGAALAERTEEDTAVFSSTATDAQTGFDFTNMTRDELARAANKLWEEGKISLDECFALQSAACNSVPIGGFTSENAPFFYSVKHNWIDEMEAMVESAHYNAANGNKTNPEHYESALKKIITLFTGGYPVLITVMA